MKNKGQASIFLLMLALFKKHRENKMTKKVNNIKSFEIYKKKP